MFVVADFEPANLDGVVLVDEADAAAPVDCPAGRLTDHHERSAEPPAPIAAPLAEARRWERRLRVRPQLISGRLTRLPGARAPVYRAQSRRLGGEGDGRIAAINSDSSGAAQPASVAEGEGTMKRSLVGLASSGHPCAGRVRRAAPHRSPHRAARPSRRVVRSPGAVATSRPPVSAVWAPANRRPESRSRSGRWPPTRRWPTSRGSRR